MTVDWLLILFMCCLYQQIRSVHTLDLIHNSRRHAVESLAQLLCPEGVVVASRVME